MPSSTRQSCAAALLLMPLLACGGAPRRPGIPARHLILVTVAGLRADHCSACLYPRPTTYVEVDGGLRAAGKALSIDDLAEEGVLFSRAFAPSPLTLPSLAAVHCGRHPLEIGVLGEADDLPAGEETLAELLSAAGFETAAFISRPAGELGAGWGQGFDDMRVGSSDTAALGMAVSWIGEADWGNSRSRFLWLHLEGPLYPFEPQALAGTDYAKLFTDSAYGGAADGSQAFRDQVMADGQGPLDVADAEQLIALYDGEIASTNYLITYFLDFLHFIGGPSGAWDRTLLGFAGVGGLELPLGTRARLDDASLRVPVFLRHPDSLTGRRVFDDVIDLQDLLPTFAEWFECELPADVRGRSLLSITAKSPRIPFEQRPAIALLPAGEGVDGLHYSVRDTHWRLIRPAQGGALQIYNQSQDAQGARDLAAVEGARCADLNAQLESWLKVHEAAAQAGH